MRKFVKAFAKMVAINGFSIPEFDNSRNSVITLPPLIPPSCLSSCTSLYLPSKKEETAKINSSKSDLILMWQTTSSVK